MAEEKKSMKHLFKSNVNGRPRVYDEEFIDKEADALYEWLNEDTGAIYFKEFAFLRGYAPSKLLIFSERSEKFREALDMAHQWQELQLSKGGITKEFAEGFTKFVLARNHGWVEQKNINITSNTPIPAWVEEATGASKDLVKND
jgi:hypothetical protein